jgi:hypothetical protein
MDVDDIDAFIVEAKTLQGPHPQWSLSTRPRQHEATWNVADALGIVRAHLRFRCNHGNRLCPSLSLVFGGAPIWRIDLEEASIRKFNPPDAAILGLLPTFLGSHEHRWRDNREYVRTQAAGTLPYRRPLPPQIRQLHQAIHHLANQINMVLSADQFGFEVPPQQELFERR